MTSWSQIKKQIARIGRESVLEPKYIDTLYLGSKQIKAFLQSTDSQYNQFVPHPREMIALDGMKIIEVYTPDYIGLGYSIEQTQGHKRIS